MKFIVPRPVFPQKLHGFFRERKKRRVLRLRRAFINAELWEIEKRGVNADDIILKVDFLPLETADVFTASSCDQKQVQHCLPLDGFLLCCVQNGGDGVRLIKIRFGFSNLRRRSLCRRVVGNQEFVLCLLHDGVNKPVIFRNGLC